MNNLSFVTKRAGPASCSTYLGKKISSYICSAKNNMFILSVHVCGQENG